MSMELLAPAGGKEALIAAIQNGADAVYLGAQMLNARAGAGNFDRDALRWAADYAHERGARIHVTVNTMVKESEGPLLEEVAEQMAFAGVDAAIVQDLGVARALRQMLPSLQLHASTQMAVHNRQGVRFAREAGFDRVVLARELTFEEIAACAREGIEIEAFAHGALCVSCSGQCLFSSLVGGRSGNRGQCAQPCRLPYRLEGAVKASGCLLSPKDLWSLDHLAELAEAGVCSLKIEGRLKRPEYVAVVTRVYREALDLLETYGEYEPEDEAREALLQIFNRGGFTQGYGPGVVDQELMSHQKPNHAGAPVGELAAPGRIHLTRDVSAADALAFRDASGGEYPVHGVAGQAGETVRVKTPSGARPGTTLWRLTSDEQMKAARASMTGENRRASVCARLYAHVGEAAVLDVTDGERAVRVEGGLVERATGKPADPARIRAQLAKTGSVPYELLDLTLNVEADAFLPASLLNELRRRAFEALGARRVEAGRGCEAAPLPPSPAGEPDQDKPAATRLRAQAPDMARLRVALESGADEAVFAPENLTRAALDEAAAQAEFSFALALPDTLDEDSLDTLNAWAWDNQEKITAVLASNAAHLAMTWPGDMQLDAGLNLASKRALAAGFEHGAALYTPSVELNAGEIRAMGAGGKRELIVYGRMRLMSLRHCPIRAQQGGKHVSCARCDGLPEDKRLNAHRLIDRTGAAFPLRRQRSEAGCIVKVMNSVPMLLLRHAGRLPAAASWRLMLTDEDARRAADIVALHRMALDGRDFKASAAWHRLENEPSTTGHYFRGVE